MKKYQKVNEEKLKERNNNIVKPPKKKKKKSPPKDQSSKKTYSLKINRKKSFKIFQGKKQTNKTNRAKLQS